MAVTKTKKVPKKNDSQYSDTPRNVPNYTTWWEKWGSLVSIIGSVVISLIGAAISWGMVMHTLGKIEQEFRDNIKYNTRDIEELKKEHDLLQKSHHSLTVEFNVQKTKLEFMEKK